MSRRGYIPVTLEIWSRDIIIAPEIEAMAYVEENDGHAWLETLFVPEWDDVLWEKHVFDNCIVIGDPAHSDDADPVTADLFWQAEMEIFEKLVGGKINRGVLSIEASGYMMDEAA